MLILEAKNIKKQYGERVLFDIENLKIYDTDKIGIVGKNGSGKTSLIKILRGEDSDIIGDVNQYGSIGYIPQLDVEINSTLSGGEHMKKKINEAFNENSDLLIADEPTSNLDTDSVRYLENRLKKHIGALIVISHDRELLTNVCNKILEIDLGKVNLYNGNYTDYMEQKSRNKERESIEYEKYTKEKRRLEDSMTTTNKRAKSMKKVPTRMGNSEARLHKRGTGERRAKLEANKKTIGTRLEQLEKKEKPFVAKEVKVTVPNKLQLNAKIICQGSEINKKYERKVLFEKADFIIENNQKTLLYGGNGSGKTTLINMIINKLEGIIHCPKLKIGYYKQNLDNLDEDLTILENVMDTTSRPEKEVRILLGNFLFRKEDVHKKVGVISGGEKVKTSFAKVFLSDINLLILDEPTNYLDIHTRQALEEAIKSYEGAVVLVSHDRSFATSIIDRVIYINDKKLHEFQGNYDEFVNLKKGKRKNSKKKKVNDNTVKLMLLENKLSNVITKLSMPGKGDKKEDLECEYNNILREIKALRDA